MSICETILELSDAVCKDVDFFMESFGIREYESRHIINTAALMDCDLLYVPVALACGERAYETPVGISMV